MRLHEVPEEELVIPSNLERYGLSEVQNYLQTNVLRHFVGQASREQ